MIRNFYGVEVHICDECGGDMFAPVGHCTDSKMIFDDSFSIMCIKCNTLFSAKTGEKVNK